MVLQYSTQEEIDESYETLTATFSTGKTKEIAWRRWQLKQLWWLVEDNTEQIINALHRDLGRHPFESSLGDLRSTKHAIMYTLKNLDKWTANVKLADAGFVFGVLGKAHYRKEPLGVALIIGTWNYPLYVALNPLVGAIAAGCCVMVKPSEVATHTEALLGDLFPKYLDPQAIRLATGGVEETTYILKKPFDQIFFVGSSKVGRVVAAAAAKHLTSTVLELGGQGPCIVTKSCDIELAARRISNTKFMNAGQICTNINHVFAEPEIADQLLERMIYWNDQYLKQGDSHMSRIINEHNFDRVVRLLNNTKGEIVYGGRVNREDKFIHPTIIKGITLDDSLMSEEIFGLLLPIITATVDEAIRITKSLPKPLAMYVFSKDDAVTNKILDQVDSGGITVNGTLFHSFVDSAPFGGVGDSGHGTFHGEHSIDCFTHKRTVVTPPSFLDRVLNVTYAPYDMKHVGRTNIANTMGFKRGETLEDQRRVGPSSSLRWVLPAISVVALAYITRKQMASIRG
ncbi:unnamed protein product [Clonostachys rhizophaga]|uniref:Aldehyde dehydrogenase n=1 Tax=Clonostachys rhizophaga TaxID=160324 RepID=A0A9N9W142_9HYPO|nr:unnamed protein product [Clonostachys rhizophaga]